MSAEIDCDYTDEPVCPHCGEEYPVCEDWGWDANNEAETQCHECGESYKVTAHYSVSYSTEKLEAGKEDA